MMSALVSRQFRNRSGRIVALCRLVLASVFLIALWVDPDQPVRSGVWGYAIISAYLAFAAAMAWVAWKSWWYDVRLARPAHAVDIAAFLVAIVFTEGSGDDFTSPFLAFFAYLMLAATVRWTWRETLSTGLIVTLLYFSTGLTMEAANIDINHLRFVRRTIYMAVLGLVLIWFGLQRQDPSIGRLFWTGVPDRPAMPLEAALAYAVEQLGASSGAILWQEEDEPLVELLDQDGVRRTIAPPPEPRERFFGEAPRIFDTRRARAIMLVDRHTRAVTGHRSEHPTAMIDIREGIAIPFATGTGAGEVFVCGIAGMGPDHLEMGRLLGAEIAATFDRHAAQVLTREAAVSRLRETLARDLHDSVAQSLAAVSLQLEGLRRFIADGGDPAPEFESLKRALRIEQQQVRGMIGKLRGGPDSREDGAEIATPGDPFELLCEELRQTWRADIHCRMEPEIAGIGLLRHQFRQLIREAVANGVRHGGAKRVEVTGTMRDGRVMLTIADDGRGFPPEWDGRPPRSIAERVSELGGTLSFDSTPQGATLFIELAAEPMR